MDSELFLRNRRSNWDRLNNILDAISQRGVAGLSQDDLKSLGPLFRRAAADLAYARTNFPGHEMIDYLNNLVVKAHGRIYRRETLGLHPVGVFFGRDFPRLVVAQRRLILAAGAILLIGLLTGYLLHFLQPALDGYVLSDSMKRAINDSLSRGQMGNDWSLAARPAISAMIMVNNIQVGILAFALGFVWGLGTVVILFKNGLLIGILAAIYAARGLSLPFWTLILPHGVLELAAIFICGGAGLVLAQAVVKPGDYRRRDALLIQGRMALKLVLGTLPLFVAAALIEGFVTPSQLPGSGKLAVAAITLAAFFLYIFTGNRRKGPGQEGEVSSR